MAKTRVNDIELYYELKGAADAPAVVFVNGLLTDTASWNNILPHFSARYRTLVWDCRGQGQSDKPGHVYETRHHIADLEALVDNLDIERAHFVGLSNGGAAALAYAADHPERVLSVVACGAYATVDTILKVKLTSWVRAMEFGGSPLRFDVAVPWVWGGRFLEQNYETLLYYREKGINMPIEWAMNLIKGAMVHDIAEKLARIKAPTLVIVGDEDVLTPVKYSQAIVDAVAGARLHVMPGIGHAAALEDVQGFARAVLHFFAEVEGGGQETSGQGAGDERAEGRGQWAVTENRQPITANRQPTTGTQHSVLSAGDLSIHYVERGEGEPIVFVHGNWATSSWWKPVLERLPHGYRGIAYDMRGRGKTEGPDTGYTMPEMAADLRALLDALALDRAHLVGHSLGSAVAMQLALESPARIKSLIAISPAWVDGMPEHLNSPAGQIAIKNDRDLFGRVLKTLAPSAPEDDFWRRLVAEGHRQRIEAALRNLPALAAWRPGDALRRAGVPALVISGTLDPLTGGDNSVRAAVALGAAHIVMRNVGHSPNLEAPDQLVALILEHLGKNVDV